jgi:hypothetical protein
MKTPCIFNGDREERHPNFTFSVTSLMLCNLLGRFSLLLQSEYTKRSCNGTLHTHARTHAHTHTICVAVQHLIFASPNHPLLLDSPPPQNSFIWGGNRFLQQDKDIYVVFIPQHGNWSLSRILYWYKAQYHHAASWHKTPGHNDVMPRETELIRTIISCCHHTENF